MLLFLGVSDSSAPAQLAKLGTVTTRNGPQGDDEFDMFAQSRNVTYENSKLGLEYVVLKLFLTLH